MPGDEMFDWPFDFLSLLIAVVALLVARKALNQASDLRLRLDAMQSFAAAATARPSPPPVPSPNELEQAPPLVAEPSVADEPAAAVAATAASGPDAIHADTTPPPPPPLPPPPPADPG